jgi:YegS/Rv2252/BmrU family lipid kinase
MELKKMLLVFNPVAGSGAFALSLFEVIDRFVRHGFEVTAYPTAAPGQVNEIILERAESFDYCVCSGGDGTLGEVVNAMMQLKKRPLLGYIPSGTTNDFAYTHGLETDVLLGAQTIIQGLPISLDVGRFRDRHFTYVAAFGLFADVSYDTPQSMKSTLGQAAYLLEGIRKLGSLRDYRCVVECDGEVITGDFILGMVANSRSVAGFRLPEQMSVRLDDGRFELILLRRIGSLAELHNVASVLTGRSLPGDSFVIRSARSITITASEPIAWSVDGEYGGSHLRADISVCQGAIQMLTGTGI